jgi:ABC-type phosphate/phosphonate transport system substrate-binding protein
MKISKYFLLLIFLVSSLHCEDENKFTFGVTTFKTINSGQNRIEKLTNNLLEKIEKDYDKDVDIIFYENEEILFQDFKERKNIEAIVVSQEFYFENKDLIKKISKNPFIYKNSEVTNSQLLLIANKNSKINSLKDLKNKVFMNSQYTQSYSIWLDYLYMKKLQMSYKNGIKEELYSSKSSRGLLDVYFNKADFCIIEKDIYEDMLLLNPSLSKNLTIIEKSPEIFFLSITLVHKDTPNKLVNLINEILDSENFKDDFREFLKLINLDSASRIEFEDLKEMEKFYEEYQELRKKYN